MSYAEARDALDALVARSAATRRRTLPGDAWVYVAFTDCGEAVHLLGAVEPFTTQRAA